LQLYFIDELSAHIVHQAGVAARHHVERAIYREVVVVRTVPVQRLVVGREARRHAELVWIGNDGSGHQRHQLNIVASIERQISYLFRIDDMRQLTRSGVQRLGIRPLHLNSLACAAHCERKICSQAPIGDQGKAPAIRLVKTRLIDVNARFRLAVP